MIFFLVLLNVIVSYIGFGNQSFFETYKFRVDKILLYKDYKRLVTGGFLHVSWLHLIFNMFSLYLISGALEMSLGSGYFLLVYFTSLAGGHLFSLYIHRNDETYSAVGASGAVCGLLFALIALYPNLGIGFFFIPISIPAWIYGAVFVAVSIYGIRSRKDNVGHDAHLGGALVGMMVALLIKPEVILTNYPEILIVLLPTMVFIFLIVTRPQVLLVDNLFYKKNKDHYSVDHRYNQNKFQSQQEIDRILDKISRKGMNSLSRGEKEKLRNYSKKV